MSKHPGTTSKRVALLVAVAMVALVACKPEPPTTVTGTDPAAPPVRPAPPSTTSPPGPQGPSVPFSLSWSSPVANGVNLSESSPVVVDNGGHPFVTVADLGGNLRAFDLQSGAPRAGWSGQRVPTGIKAPLSSDGVNVYVPVNNDSVKHVPQHQKRNAAGSLVWSSNPNIVPKANGGHLYSGLALGKVRGRWQGFTGSGWYLYGFDGVNGAKKWSFRNLESTISTPAVADLYGAGEPQVVVSTNKGPASPSTNVGGYLRIFAADGRRICSATQPAAGRRYVSSGYNNASPVVGEVDGQPLVFLGSTGPVQYGDGGNQILAYTAGCSRAWASAPLAGPAVPSPSMADVLGRGTPQVVTMAGVADGPARKYPRVYVLDPATGKTLVDTGRQLAGYGGNLAYPQSMSVTTADVDGDGHQDLFVPARNVVVVLSGRTRAVLAELPISAGAGAMQNTPVITANPTGGIRVTLAGYTSNNGTGHAGGVIRSYVIPGGRLGATSWSTFGGNAQRSGQGTALRSHYNQLLEGTRLRAGETMRTPTGSFRATMQGDGNLVVRRASGAAVWSTGTRVHGSYATLATDGRLQIRRPADGHLLWTSPATASGVERLVLGNDGTLSVYSANNVKILEDITTRPTRIWHS